MIKKALFVSGIMLFAAQAQAAAPDGNFYVGGGVGQATYYNDTIDDLDDIDGVDVDDQDTAFTIFGGYRFNSYLGLELGYVDFGEATASVSGYGEVAKVEVDGGTLSLLGRLPLTSNVSLLGRAGGIYWNGKAQALGDSEDQDGLDPLVGAGVELTFEQFFARAEYTRYFLNVDVENADDEDLDIGMWAASVGLNF